jgi:hypothetical protein
MATSENLEDWQSITLYEENKWHLAQISDVSEGFRRFPKSSSVLSMHITVLRLINDLS